MRRRRVSVSAARSATIVLVLVVVCGSTAYSTNCHHRVRHSYDHEAAVAAITRPACSFRGRRAGGGCASRRRGRRRTPRDQARAVTSTAFCGFATPPIRFSPAAAGSAAAPTTAARPVHRTAGGEGNSRSAIGAIDGAGLDAPRQRGTLGDRAKRRLLLERGPQKVDVDAGLGRAADPMKTKLGKSELEVCRVINGLCQGPLDDTSGDSTDALRSMDRLAEEFGQTTFQLGNSAGGGRALAERRAGSYLKSAAGAASGSREVRFLNTLGLRRGVAVTRKAVKAALEASLSRMGVERLDLVQLCWRDFEDRYFLDALYYLEESECVSNVGVCGFPTAPLALAGANGFMIASNLVASSLIKTPTDGGTDSLGRPTLARQCAEQGVSLVSSSGASLGGFAADEWAFRGAPSGSNEEGLPLGARLALLDILAWGGSSSSSSSSESASGEPWRLYQSKLLPELQAVARKHGRGLSPADVATAFHLYRKEAPFPALMAAATNNPEANFGTKACDTMRTSAAAVTLPVRVKAEGSLSARRKADAEEDRVAGRRGAELAEMLDLEDVERVAAAVEEGKTSRGDCPGTAGDWEQELLGGAERGEEEEEEEGRGGELWSLEVGAEGPTIFL